MQYKTELRDGRALPSRHIRKDNCVSVSCLYQIQDDFRQIQISKTQKRILYLYTTLSGKKY